MGGESTSRAGSDSSVSGTRRVSSGAPWEPIVGYSRAVRTGVHVAVSGTAAVDAAGKVIAPGNAREQTVVILKKIEAALIEAGAVMADVIRTRIYVTNIKEWEAIGRAHGEVFGTIRPATTMVEVARLIDPAMCVEIEADAIVRERA